MTDGHQAQEVDVVVNGERVDSWTLATSDVTERHAWIPANVAVRRQPMMITFNIHHPIAPSAIGSSRDRRLLGIGMEELRISPSHR